ncbi:MAG: nitrophenyl compound nitroreductase subunit ArsF family protein [Verrucomicrobia bacterium]|nr:nitrophenyl compound nitroreductase subunit ArsF family protein [Verrucomicrobiota bacterium]
MKSLPLILLGLALFLCVAIVTSPRSTARSGTAGGVGACCPPAVVPEPERVVAPADSPVAPVSAEQVIVAYFHGTVRCEACLRIEHESRVVVEQHFGPERAAQRLSFVSVDYDLPENAHFLTAYQLPCPSLVLVRQAAGQALEWKLLAETWQWVHEPLQLAHYIETEVRSFLAGEGGSADAEAARTVSAAEQP